MDMQTVANLLRGNAKMVAVTHDEYRTSTICRKLQQQRSVTVTDERLAVKAGAHKCSVCSMIDNMWVW